MRISTLFLAGFCLVALPGGISTGWFAAESWQALRRAERARTVMAALDATQRAQFALALEAGTMDNALLSATPDRALLAEFTRGSEALLPRLREAATAAGLGAEAVAALMAELGGLRPRVAAALDQPVAQRDPALRPAAQRLRAEGVAQLQRLGETGFREMALLAPRLVLLGELANVSSLLRDVVGRRNGRVVAWLNGAAPDAADLRLTQELTGRAAQHWEALERLTAALPENAALVAALAQQRRDYLQGAEPRWRAALDRAAQALGAGTAPAWPETVAQWRAWANPAQAGILAMRDAALEAARDRAEAASTEAGLRFALALALALLGLGLALGSVLVLLRRLGHPLQRLTQSVTAIAGGEYGTAVPGRGRPDELGDMAAAVETLRAGSEERQRLAAQQQQAEAAARERAARLDLLIGRFEEETSGVLRVVAAAATELDATAGGMAGIAADGIRRAGAVADASGRTSENVQTVAAATEQLSASISEVARQVRDSAGKAREAVAAAGQAERTVVGLADAAARIGDVVQLISNIAGQTNLLALNATIEAARAGEAGKGFAVVASEVKSLASQTAKATEEIGNQIAGMQAETNRTVEAISEINALIEALSGAITHVAEAAGQQAEATQEIGRAVAQAAEGADAASRHASGVSGDAERTGQAAGEVRGASAELAQRAEGLRARTEDFLRAMRAA